MQHETTYTPPRFSSWLWPNRAIGKRESEKLRKEHNLLVSNHARLLEALRCLVRRSANQLDQSPTRDGIDNVDALVAARAAIAKAEGGEA